MTMPRVVTPEALDGLAVDDPVAMRSRRDLRRVHRAMGTRSILLHALRGMPTSRRAAMPLRVLELGAGDGSLMLGVARALAPEWPPVELTLLDAQSLVERATVENYAKLGWRVQTIVADVLDWAAGPGGPPLKGGEAAPAYRAAAAPAGVPTRWDVIVANLFLHHFKGAQLAALLAAVAVRGDAFFACEPRRARLALAGSHLLGALGANAVTRADAVLSVHAGFCDNELTTLWPATSGWQVQEYSAGFFSHCFRAQRVGAL